MSKAEQDIIARYFPKKPVLYIGGLGTIFSPNAGIFLTQLLYWHGKGKRKDGWIYKTATDIQQETGLTRTNQETAIKLLLRYEVIEYKLAGVPAKRNFRVDMKRLHVIIPSLKASSNLSYPNPPNYIVENGETITKITRENTTKNTRVKISSSNFFEEKNKLIGTRSMRGP